MGIARALGAEVTGVCSTRNVDTARKLGADRVVDYTCEDFTQVAERYDLLLDVAGSRSWAELERVLTPTGTVVVAGAPKGGRLLGPVRPVARLRLGAMRSRRTVVFFIARLSKPDLETLGTLLADGALTPVIDRRYPLGELAEALRYVGEGHARGKVVVTV